MLLLLVCCVFLSVFKRTFGLKYDQRSVVCQSPFSAVMSDLRGLLDPNVRDGTAALEGVSGQQTLGIPPT